MENPIQKELNNFETEFHKFTDEKVNDFLISFLFAKSKRLRPLLGILFLKSIGVDLNSEYYKHFIAVELIHNASLLHDDVIDNAEKRRNNKSINAEYNNSLAVAGGDLLLALSMDLILEIKNSKVQNLFVKNMFEICRGEINQYFSKFKMPLLNEYIEKSKQKTALLFETSVLGAIMISENNSYYEAASGMSRNFGIAFQIKNDLQNYLTTKDDYEQGIYTAPVIFDTENSIEKTKDLINNYFEECLKFVRQLPDNEFSQAIEYITKKLKE